MRGLLVAALVALFVAPVTALAAPPPRPQQVHKPVVSIDDIRDLANTGQSEVLKQMIETTIINTGKFRIMERGEQGTGVLLREQQGAKAGLYTSNTPGKIGGFEGVDFKVYGTITTAGAGRKRDAGASLAMGLGGSMLGGPLGGFMQNHSDCRSNSASIAIDIRITDASTGEERYAKEITQTEKGATTCGGGSDNVDLNALFRSAAQNISMGLVTTMYPVKVVGIGSEGVVLLNYGEGLLEPGEVMAIFQQGESIVDPDTGAVLGNSESLLGLVRVSEVLPKMSKSTILTGFATPPAVGSIARDATPEQMRALAPPKRR
jgi:curli biogenesis system outer membrane secretion channel CsgG